MVEPRLLQQRQPDLRRVVAGQRLGVVVEVDEQRLVEAGLDEAVGVPVEAGLERLVRRGTGATFSTSVSPSKWVTDPAFEAGTLAASPITKTFGARLGLQGVLVGGHEVELVTESRRTTDVRRRRRAAGTTTARSNGDLATVVADELAGRRRPRRC